MKNNKLPSLISILILTLLTAITWVSFSIYRALTISAPPSIPQDISQPLTPTLDQNSISKIESSIFLDDSQIPQNVVSETPLPSPILLATPIASPSPTASPTASPSASPSPTATP
jgi:hypothetical protein